MDISETRVMNKDKVFFAHEMAVNEYWMDDVIDLLTDNVFITFDLDALDPSIMPSTGTPEPGGLFYYETLEFLKKVFAERNVVGFDMVELCPNPQDKSSDFLAAKIYYKMLSYKFSSDMREEEEDYVKDNKAPFNKISKFNDHDEHE
jgi:agmatinase